MGYTVPDTVAIEPTFVAFLYSTLKHMSLASREEPAVNSNPPILSSGIVACTFSDNLSQNNCLLLCLN